MVFFPAIRLPIMCLHSHSLHRGSNACNGRGTWWNCTCVRCVYLCKKMIRFNKQPSKSWRKMWKQAKNSFYSILKDPFWKPNYLHRFPLSCWSSSTTKEQNHHVRPSLFIFVLLLTPVLASTGMSFRSSEIRTNTANCIQCYAKSTRKLQGEMRLWQRPCRKAIHRAHCSSTLP